MSDPLDDFDPLAAIEAMSAATPPHHPGEHWGAAVEVPISLDVLASPQPSETPAALLARAVAVASAGGPVVPARPVRSASPHYAPPPPLPYPFDGTNPLANNAIARLVLPATSTHSANERTAAALLLLREYQTHNGPMGLPLFLSLFWKAARRHVDIAATLKQPGLSPNALRMRVLRPAAHDFADAKGILPASRPAAFEAAGIPMPRDKKGKPTSDGAPPSYSR